MPSKSYFSKCIASYNQWASLNPLFFSNSYSKSVMPKQSKVIFYYEVFLRNKRILLDKREDTLRPVTHILGYCRSACCPTAHCPSLTKPQWECQGESSGKAKQAVVSEYIWQHDGNATGHRRESVKYQGEHIQFCIGRGGTEVDSHPKEKQPSFVLWERNDTSDRAVPVFLVKGRRNYSPLQTAWGRQSKSNINVKTWMIVLLPSQNVCFCVHAIKAFQREHTCTGSMLRRHCIWWRKISKISHTYGCSQETKPSKSP